MPLTLTAHKNDENPIVVMYKGEIILQLRVLKDTKSKSLLSFFNTEEQKSVINIIPPNTVGKLGLSVRTKGNWNN